MCNKQCYYYQKHLGSDSEMGIKSQKDLKLFKYTYHGRCLSQSPQHPILENTALVIGAQKVQRPLLYHHLTLLP